MQPNGGLVENEERVHQRGSESRGQVHPLHLPSGERTGLAVERQVAEADGVQVTEPGGDLLHHEALRPLQLPGCKLGQNPDAGEHRQLPELRQRHSANAKAEGLRPQAAAAAGWTLVEAAVARQEHSHVHPVLLLFEAAEKTFHPGPAAPAAVDDEGPVLPGELLPGNIHVESPRLAGFPAFRTPAA